MHTTAEHTSIATTPLELLGSSAGLSVVDPGTVLTRLWYFDGKFLRAAGFRLDQEYVRSLVALSNQAAGAGVVHGFDVGRTAGDRLRIEGGLALAPSGRVVYLPQRVELSIAELIARSTGRFDPMTPPPPGVADFRLCPPDQSTAPDVTVPARPLYVLTVASVEALCGEEERFGQLCQDACATETDRSKVVEGVCFRVRELTLALPRSTAVPFANQHLRSRVASAFFALERQASGSMISGVGLRNPVWCAAAEGIGGEEVALAVLDRAGAVTGFVDGWIARRELMETTPHRYWAGRMAMRPWDVFLAQILQFQCQLLDLGEGGAGTTVDPCAGERDTLVAAEQVLGSLAEVSGAERAGVGSLAPDAFSRVAAVRAKIQAILGTKAPSGSGSLLVDGGIVELPAAGYLPTSLEGDLAQQVRALLGPGVDLRLCAVRPDFVPQALLEAQHMDRISLTRGLDEPTALEEVDILVPGGEVIEAPRSTPSALIGVLRLRPRDESTREGAGVASALSLSVVARAAATTGWSCSVAAYGEAASQLTPADLLGGTPARGAFEGTVGAAEAQPTEMFVRADAEHDRIRIAPAFVLRMRRESHTADLRRMEAARLGATETAPDRDRLPATSDRDWPVAAWLDAETTARLDTIPVGGSTDVRIRASVYARFGGDPMLQDIRVTGTLRVVDVHSVGTQRTIQTVLDGVVDAFESGAARSRLMPLREFPLTWTMGQGSSGVRTLAVGLGRPRVATVTFTDAGAPRRVTGEAVQVASTSTSTPAGAPADVEAPVMVAAVDGPSRLASLELDEEDGALLPGATGRTLADSVISILGAELARSGRDPAFAAYATPRLLAGVDNEVTSEVRARSDWVLFHRRRTKVCAGIAVDRPVRTRTYRLFHRKVDQASVADELRKVLADATAAADQLGFEPVATVEFAEGMVELRTPASVLRTSWRADDRGQALLLAAAADVGAGDGEAVALGRLGTVRSVLSDLVDTSEVRGEYLHDIPVEFREPGLDGVMFTIGFDNVTKACVTIYRLSREQYERVVKQWLAVGPKTDLPAIIEEAGATAEVFTATFDGDRLADPELLSAQWSDLHALTGALGLPPSATEPEVAAARGRLAQIAELIGLEDVSGDHVPAQTGACGAVLLVAAEPVNP